MDRESVQLVMDTDSSAVNPFGKVYPFYAIIETGSTKLSTANSNEEKSDPDVERLFSLFESAEDLIIDGVVAQDGK